MIQWRPNLNFEEVKQCVEIITENPLLPVGWEELQKQADFALRRTIYTSGHANIFIIANKQEIYITSYIPEYARKENEHHNFPMWTRRLVLFKSHELARLENHPRKFKWLQVFELDVFQAWIKDISVELEDVSI